MMNQTAFDFTDVQGIVRFGHGRLKAACMLLLSIKDPAAARRWLRHTAFTSGASSDPPPDKALQIANVRMLRTKCRTQRGQLLLQRFRLLLRILRTL